MPASADREPTPAARAAARAAVRDRPAPAPWPAIAASPRARRWRTWWSGPPPARRETCAADSQWHRSRAAAVSRTTVRASPQSTFCTTARRLADGDRWLLSRNAAILGVLTHLSYDRREAGDSWRCGASCGGAGGGPGCATTGGGPPAKCGSRRSLWGPYRFTPHSVTPAVVAAGKRSAMGLPVLGQTCGCGLRSSG